jgi:HEAT repeat protein
MGIIDLFKPNVERMATKRNVNGLLELVMKDKDRGVRYSAIDALGNIRDNKAVDPLIQTLRDKDEKVRKGVAYALGEIGDQRAVKPLIQTLKDIDENVRSITAEALGKIRDKSAVEPLIQTLKDKDDEVRRAAAWALGEIRDKRAVEPLIQALKDEDKEVRRTTVDALGKSRDKGAINPLIDLLNKNNIKLKNHVINALKKINTTEALEALQESFREGRDVEFATEALEALKKKKEKEKTKKKKTPKKRKSIQRVTPMPTIGKLTVGSHIEGLLDALSKPNQKTQLRAAETLKGIPAFMERFSGYMTIEKKYSDRTSHYREVCILRNDNVSGRQIILQCSPEQAKRFRKGQNVEFSGEILTVGPSITGQIQIEVKVKYLEGWQQ